MVVSDISYYAAPILQTADNEHTKTQLARSMCIRGYLDYTEKPKQYIKNPEISQVPRYRDNVKYYV